MKLIEYFSPRVIYYVYSSAWGLFFSLVTTIFSLYHIEMVKLNPFQLVLVGTVLEGTCLLFEIPTGIVADNYSRKRSLVYGLLLMGCGFSLEGNFPVFFMILAAQVVWGIGATFLSGADTAWINDELSGKKVDEILLKGAQLRQFFMLIGIFLSIGLAGINLNLPIQVSGVSFGLLGVFLWLFMPENHYKPISVLARNSWKTMYSTFNRGIGLIKGNPVLSAVFLATVFTGLFSEGFDRLWTYKLLTGIQFPLLHRMKPLYWFAVFSSGAVLLNLVVIEAAKKRLKKSRGTILLRILFFVNLSLSIAIFMFAYTGNFFLSLVSFWFCQAMRSANTPLTALLLNNNIRDSGIRATVLSMNGQVDGLGQIIGGPVLGLIANRFGVSVGLAVAGFLLLPVFFIYLHRSGKQDKTSMADKS